MGGIEGEVTAVYVGKDQFSLFDYLLGTSLKEFLVNFLKGELTAEAMYRPDAR